MTAPAPIPAQGAPLLIDDHGTVTYAPEWVQFDLDWLTTAAAARAVTVVGLDVVVHAANGDFHYRHEAGLPHVNAALFRRVENG